MPLPSTSKWSAGAFSRDSIRKRLRVSSSIAAIREAPGPIRIAATFSFIATLNAFVRGALAASARSRRSASTAAEVSESRTPSPPQVVHLRVRISRGPSVTFWRVISTRPSGEISTTYVFVRSRSSSFFSASSTAARFFGFAMSMKSMTMIPPMSRSLSWCTTSLTASRLFFVIVSSRRPDDPLPREPTKRPVLTSMTVKASA